MSRVVRVLLILFLLKATLGVIAQLPAAESSIRLATWLNTLDLRAALLGVSSPAVIWSALTGASGGLATCVCLTGLALVALAVLLRPSASCAIVLALGLIYGTLRSSGADLPGEVQSGNGLLLLLVIAMFGLPLLFGSIRWGLLLSVQGIHLPLTMLVRLTLIGHFFNVALPGAVTGDLLKMGYIMRHAPDRKAEAVLSIMVDRIIGVLGLCVIAGLMVLLMLDTILGFEDWALKGAALVVGLGSVGGVAGILVVEMRGRFMRFGIIARTVELVAKRLPGAILDIFDRVIAATEQYRSHRMTVCKALLLAIGVHSVLGLSLCLSGRALGEGSLGLQDYFLTAQVANSVAAIPITPGGVGTRDAVAAAYLEALGAEPRTKAAVTQVIVTIAMVMWALIGAIVFVLSSQFAEKPGGEAATSPVKGTETMNHEA
ncbi:MAG: flippase-like domain-containing protein [Lentisphaeria bacterium]|nr:flippase-like domain-containing protein [Lentisphaeria bacterium]